MELNIRSAIESDIAILVADGELDLHTADELDRVALDLLDRDLCYFIIDLTGIAFMSTAGLSSLLRIGKEVRKRDGWLKIVINRSGKSGGRVAKWIITTGLIRILPIYGSVSEAVSFDWTERLVHGDVPEDVSEIRSWVGNDAVRAQAALWVEFKRPSRSRRDKLISELRGIVATGIEPWIPMRIFLDAEEGRGEIEQALLEVIDVFGFDVIYDAPGIIGSWFHEFFLRAKKVVEANTEEDRLEEYARALRIKLLDQQQAQVDSMQADAVSKLLTAVGDRKNALLQVGSVLLIIVDGVPVVRNLTQLELIFYERNPILFRDPAKALAELQKATTNELASSGDGP